MIRFSVGVTVTATEVPGVKDVSALIAVPVVSQSMRYDIDVGVTADPLLSLGTMVIKAEVFSLTSESAAIFYAFVIVMDRLASVMLVARLARVIEIDPAVVVMFL